MFWFIWNTIGDIYNNKNESDTELKSKFDSKWNELLKEMENNKYSTSSIFCVYYHLRLKIGKLGVDKVWCAFPVYKKMEMQESKITIHQRFIRDILSCIILISTMIWIALLHSIMQKHQKDINFNIFCSWKCTEFDKKSILNKEWIKI